MRLTRSPCRSRRWSSSSGVVGQRVERHPAGHPQRQLQALDPAGLVVELLEPAFGRAPGRDRIDVALGRADVPPATAGQVRVGRAPEPPVVALGPVEEVVPALEARSGPVRDLVPAEPGPPEQLVGQQVLVGLVVVIGVAGRVGGQRGAGLDGERVRAHVRRLERDHPLEREAPVVDRLTGPAVDEVEVERGEPGPTSRVDRPLDVGHIMGAAQTDEHVVDHRLHAERQPGHPTVAVGVEQLVGHGVGVALDGDLGALDPVDRGQHPHQVGGRHQRRGAAAEEDGRGGRATGGGEGSHLLLDRAEVGPHQVGPIGPRGERAVIAAPRAERDVHVGTELGQTIVDGRRRGGHGRRGYREAADRSRRRGAARLSGPG